MHPNPLFQQRANLHPGAMPPVACAGRRSGGSIVARAMIEDESLAKTEL
jgi:hypothetical protein